MSSLVLGREHTFVIRLHMGRVSRVKVSVRDGRRCCQEIDRMNLCRLRLILFERLQA
jgi:hypothetical protein